MLLYIVIFWILLVAQAPTFIWVLFWIHFAWKLFLFFIDNILYPHLIAEALDENYNKKEDNDNELF